MHRTLQPGPIEYDDLGSVWCHGYVQRFDNRTPAEIKERIAGWRKMLTQQGRTLIGEPQLIDHGSYVLVIVRFTPYPTGRQIRERGTRGGTQAAQRRTSWMDRLSASVPSLTPTPQPA